MKKLLIILILGLILLNGCVEEKTTKGTKQLFDIPALINKDINQIKQILGEPTNEIKDEQDIIPNYDGEIYFNKNKFELSIEYFKNKPLTFSLCSDESVDFEDILRAGNLNQKMVTGSETDNKEKYFCVNIAL